MSSPGNRVLIFLPLVMLAALILSRPALGTVRVPDAAIPKHRGRSLDSLRRRIFHHRYFVDAEDHHPAHTHWPEIGRA